MLSCSKFENPVLVVRNVLYEEKWLIFYKRCGKIQTQFDPFDCTLPVLTSLVCFSGFVGPSFRHPPTNDRPPDVHVRLPLQSHSQVVFRRLSLANQGVEAPGRRTIRVSNLDHAAHQSHHHTCSCRHVSRFLGLSLGSPPIRVNTHHRLFFHNPWVSFNILNISPRYLCKFQVNYIKKC